MQSELAAAAGQQWCLVTLGSQPQSLGRCWGNLFLWDTFLQHNPTSKPKNSAPIPLQKSCSHPTPAPKLGKAARRVPSAVTSCSPAAPRDTKSCHWHQVPLLSHCPRKIIVARVENLPARIGGCFLYTLWCLYWAGEEELNRELWDAP